MAVNVFGFKLPARVSVVHNDKTTGTKWALTDEQRRELRHKLCHAAIVGGIEQMYNNLDNPSYLLDTVRQQDSVEEISKDLRNLLRLSASRRQKSMAASQSHWGIQNFVDAHMDEITIGDMILKMISRLMGDEVEEGCLRKLKNIPTDSKYHLAGPSNTRPMSSSEAFAAAVLEIELCLQLEE